MRTRLRSSWWITTLITCTSRAAVRPVRAHQHAADRPPARQQFRSGISFRQAGVDRVDVEADRVYLDEGQSWATTSWWSPQGARLLPEETEGRTGPGWLESVFTFYTPEGAVALHRALERFTAACA